MLYNVVLFLHSWVRWGVVFCGVFALAASLRCWLGGRDWLPVHRRLQVAFVSLFDTQMLLGLTLYFVLSPLTPRTLEAFRTSMSVSFLRFFSVEHPTMMLLALAAAHVASALSRRALEPTRKHRVWAVGLLVVMLLVALGIPWQGLSYGRPLVRGF
ncbi:hypothetical protein ACLESO_30170 [Pyxidicoccus sp. 3LG]